MNGHSIAFVYHSGKIENDNITYHDTREIFEHDGVTSYTGDLRTLFEIRNEKEAYDIRRWQLGERPREYKHHDYVTGKEESESRRRTCRKKWPNC